MFVFLYFFFNPHGHKPAPFLLAYALMLELALFPARMIGYRCPYLLAHQFRQIFELHLDQIAMPFRLQEIKYLNPAIR